MPTIRPSQSSFPALYRQDTTSWNTDGRENKLSEAIYIYDILIYIYESEALSDWHDTIALRGSLAAKSILQSGISESGRERPGMEKASILIKIL